MHERREPGAEVVEGEAHTEAPEGVHGLLDQIAATHHGGFGQFELQPLRLDTALGNQATEGRQQLAVLELPE
ncbi:hypothetical protein D3C86_1313840 [compost metagenome]